MQNPIQKFRQNSIVFKKPGITNVYKKVSGSFLFFLDLELFAKIKKTYGFYALAFYIFINNSRSKQNKKKSYTLFCIYL